MGDVSIIARSTHRRRQRDSGLTWCTDEVETMSISATKSQSSRAASQYRLFHPVSGSYVNQECCSTDRC